MLDTAIRNADFCAAAEELLLQGMVLLWGAFEVVAKDTFVVLLNNEPGLIDNLRTDSAAKRRFDLVAKIPYEVLESFGYNLSGKLGTLLGDQQDFSDLTTVKVVYNALFPRNAALRETLSNKDLWILSQRRHLVVHRRGVIDSAFIKTTKSSLAIGERLKVQPSEVEMHISTVIQCASDIIGAASTVFDERQGTEKTNEGST